MQGMDREHPFRVNLGNHAEYLAAGSMAGSMQLVPTHREPSHPVVENNVGNRRKRVLLEGLAHGVDARAGRGPDVYQLGEVVEVQLKEKRLLVGADVVGGDGRGKEWLHPRILAQELPVVDFDERVMEGVGKGERGVAVERGKEVRGLGGDDEGAAGLGGDGVEGAEAVQVPGVAHGHQEVRK